MWKLASNSWSTKSLLRQTNQIRPLKVRKQTFTHQNGPNRQLTPFERYPSDGGIPAGPGVLLKPFIFTISFGVGTLTAVSIWEYEKIRGRAINAVKGFTPITSWAQKKFGSSRKQVMTWQDDVRAWWQQLPIGEKVFLPICALNVLVFAMWRIPRFQPAMIKYFCSNPAAQAVCWPMFLSTFSHYSLFHLCANMYVLHSFSNIAVMSLGREQFTFLYLLSGVTASLASYVYKVGLGQVGLSIGASGAIMAILAYVCTEYPDTKLSIILIPTLTFSAGMAIKCIMGLDLAGLLMGWKVFDHAAHLGGASLGVLWGLYGKEYLWPKREIILKEYHKLRLKSQ